MALGFLDLNEDCQREIIKTVLLDSEAKTLRVVDTTPHGSAMTTERPAASNALTLVNKAIHALFEDEVRRYQVTELRSLGWNLGASLTKWNLLCFKDVRYLRLILDFTPRSILDRNVLVADVRQSLLEVAQLLTQHFQGLTDLQLVVQVEYKRLDGTEDDTQHELREFLLHKFAHQIDELSKLKAVHVWYVIMDCNAALSLPHSTKRKTSKGWRHDLKAFKMTYSPLYERQAMEEMVKSIGLEPRSA